MVYGMIYGMVDGMVYDMVNAFVMAMEIHPKFYLEPSACRKGREWPRALAYNSHGCVCTELLLWMWQ